jgi:hypothetical protein
MPMIDVATTWLVDTGAPTSEAVTGSLSPEVSCESSACIGRTLKTAKPSVRTMRQPPDRMPGGHRRGAGQHHPERHLESGGCGRPAPARQGEHAHAFLGVVGAVRKRQARGGHVLRPGAASALMPRSGGAKGQHAGTGLCRPGKPTHEAQHRREHQGQQHLHATPTTCPCARAVPAPGHVIRTHGQRAAPRRPGPPTRPCDDDDGIPFHQVTRFQTIAPPSPETSTEQRHDGLGQGRRARRRPRWYSPPPCPPAAGPRNSNTPTTETAMRRAASPARRSPSRPRWPHRGKPFV